jgi:NitT/TauT family transport system substrate-binding protein
MAGPGSARLARVLAAMAVIGVMLVSGSGAAQPDPGDGTPPPVVTVRFATRGVGASSVTDLIAELAQNKGFFLRHGIDLQVIHFIQGGAEAMAGVASGGIDMGTFGTPILIGIAAGLPIKIVGSPPQKRQSFELVARKGINSVKELKGKVVTSGALGGGSHESLLKILHDNGLTENDVGVVATGGTDTAQMALRSGKVDAVVTAGLIRIKLVDDGVGTLIARARDYYGRYQHSFVLATNEFIKAHPEAIRNYFLAEREALEYAKTHLDEVVDYAARRIKLKKELIADYYRELFDEWDLSFAIDVEGTANAVAILKDLKEIKPTVRFNPDTWLDPRFLD